MSPALRSLASTTWSLSAAPLWGALLLVGCGALGAPSGDFSDAGSQRGPDAGWIEAGTPPAVDAGPSGPEFAAGSDPSTCYDQRDNDTNAAADCDDESCYILPSCCVESSRDACCTSGPPLGFADLSACGDLPADECGVLAEASFLPFGLPTPVVEGGRLIPNGDHSYDSGVLRALALDAMTQRVRLRATLGVGDGACGAGCLDAIAFGVTEQATLGESSEVRPAVALVENGVRGELRVLVLGEVVRSFPLRDRAEHTYELLLRPEGRFDVYEIRGTDPVILAADIAYAPSAAFHAVVYGRSEGHTSPEQGARLASFTVESSRCHMPSAQSRLGRVLPREGAIWANAAPRVDGPAVSLGPDGATWMLFSLEGSVYLAREGPDGFELDGEDRVPLLTAPLEYPGGLSEPSLLRLPEGGYLTLVTAYDDAGSSRILSARSETEEPLSFGELTPIDLLLPTEPPITDLSDPSLIRIGGGEAAEAGALFSGWDLVGGDLVLAVRAKIGGAPSILLLRSEDGGLSFAPMQLPEGRFDVVQPRLQTLTAFDHDEVASPELLFAKGVYHLYYAGRRGTRWSLGLLVSDDLRSFRAVRDGLPLMEGSGSGFDALGVRAPASLAREDRIELYYVGSDGARERIGRSESPLP